MLLHAYLNNFLVFLGVRVVLAAIPWLVVAVVVYIYLDKADQR